VQYQSNITNYNEEKKTYKVLCDTMASEEDRVKKKREEIADLKDQIFNMSQKYDKLDSQNTKAVTEVNELLFLLQRYPEQYRSKDSI
jgi:chromosome segregation ATPase